MCLLGIYTFNNGLIMTWLYNSIAYIIIVYTHEAKLQELFGGVLVIVDSFVLCLCSQNNVYVKTERKVRSYLGKPHFFPPS